MNSQTVNPVTPVATKKAIIGKMWVSDTKLTLVPASMEIGADTEINANQSFLIGNMSFRANRHLNSSRVAGEVAPLILKAGSKLFFYANTKRDNKQDPDYNVSIELPIAEADVIIQNDQKGLRDWQDANQDAQA